MIKATTKNVKELGGLMEVANVADTEKSVLWKEVNELRDKMMRRWGRLWRKSEVFRRE